MIKAMECYGEIMSDGHLNIPEGEKQLLTWKAGRMIRLIILNEEAVGEDMLKKLQEKGLVKVSAREKIKPLSTKENISMTTLYLSSQNPPQSPFSKGGLAFSPL